MRLMLSLFAAVMLAPQAVAQVDVESHSLRLLSGDSLRAAFSDVTVDGTYKEFRERSGTARFTERFTRDGKTFYREGDIIDEGEWALANDTVICFRYFGELAGGVSCYTVFTEGTCLYAYHPSRIIDGRPIDRNQWSAKTVNRGELSTCDDLVS